MHESSGFRKCSTLLLFQLFPWRLCLCLCVSIFVRIWVADVMSFQKMYGLRGPWGLNMVNQAFRIKIANRSKEKEKEKKIPGIGRYLMGPTEMCYKKSRGVQKWSHSATLETKRTWNPNIGVHVLFDYLFPSDKTKIGGRTSFGEPFIFGHRNCVILQSFQGQPKSWPSANSLAYSSSQSQATQIPCRQKRLFLGVFLEKKSFPGKTVDFHL